MSVPPKTAADIVLRQIAVHEQHEEEVLKDYASSAQNVADRGVRFLMDLILEDEQRHHRLMAWMATGIRHSLEQTEGGPGSLPLIEPPAEAQSDLLAVTERFLEVERTELRTLHDIAHTVGWIESPESSLPGGIQLPKPPWTAEWMRSAPVRLILETMVDDSRKHIRILEHIRKRLSGERNHTAGGNPPVEKA